MSEYAISHVEREFADLNYCSVVFAPAKYSYSAGRVEGELRGLDS